MPLCRFLCTPVCGLAHPCCVSVCVCMHYVFVCTWCVCVCVCVGAELELCPQVTGWRSLSAFIYSGALQILTNLSL
jgi:hypothetical protein